jgi:hypothetical protein
VISLYVELSPDTLDTKTTLGQVTIAATTFALAFFYHLLSSLSEVKGLFLMALSPKNRNKMRTKVLKKYFISLF